MARCPLAITGFPGKIPGFTGLFCRSIPLGRKTAAGFRGTDTPNLLFNLSYIKIREYILPFLLLAKTPI